MAHSYKKALDASIKYFDGNDLAAQVWVDKYALRDEKKRLLELTPTDMHRRMAKEFARVERKKYGDKALTEDAIFDLLDGFKRIIPQGGCMYGIGNTQQFVTLSNCYAVDPPLDSYGGIHYTDQQITQISKRRGGCGTDISELRPNTAPTRNSSRTSTGPVCFAARFSHSIREVGQDGRRGALMLSLHVNHPDVVDFARCKTDRTQVTGANLSIRLSDQFMKAVVNNKEYIQQWPVEGKPVIRNRVPARTVWRDIIKNAHAHAEPGLLFWDTILRESPADCYWEDGFRTIATNPCSELPLPAGDSCRLLVQRILSYVVNPFTDNARFDWAAFYDDAVLAQRLLDDIIDLELECVRRIIQKIKDDPEPDHIKRAELELWEHIEAMCHNGRRTGLGLVGLADTLAALGIGYNSKEALRFVDRAYRTLKFASYWSSTEMAKELEPFPVWKWANEKDHPFLLRFKEEEVDLEDGRVISGETVYNRMGRYGRRNIANLTQSPTGSCAIVARCSAAGEPLFAMQTRRRKKGNPGDEGFRTDFVDDSGDHWMEFTSIHPAVRDWAKVNSKDLTIGLGTTLPEAPWAGHEAHAIPWKQRIAMQALMQRHIDHSISSTVNLPSDATPTQVGNIYLAAWKAGCKGITVYRDGARENVIKSVDKSKSGGIIHTTAPKRPRELPCEVYHIQVQHEPYLVLVGLYEGDPYEVFALRNGHIPKDVKRGTIVRKRKNFYTVAFEGCDVEFSPITAMMNTQEETITRLTSTALRHGAEMYFVVKQLEKVGENTEMNSFARAMARTLKKYIPDGTQDVGEPCETCGAEPLVREEGCKKCLACGWSKCL